MPTRLARSLPSLQRTPYWSAWRTVMKFETVMLHSLFASCMMICVATLTAMLV